MQGGRNGEQHKNQMAGMLSRHQGTSTVYARGSRALSMGCRTGVCHLSPMSKGAKGGGTGGGMAGGVPKGAT